MHVDLMRDKAKIFPNIEAKDLVRSMRIWHCGYKSLAKISEFINLEELIIGSIPDDSIFFLENLIHLRYLAILHLPKVAEIGPLGGCQKLEVLSLATSPSWDASGKTTIVESLDPLSEILTLKNIELFGVHPPDKMLTPLERCSGLISAKFSKYPKTEIERFFKVTKISEQYNPEPRCLSKQGGHF